MNRKVIWLTGRSGAGKTTLAKALKKYLQEEKMEKVVILDGDELRKGLNYDLGFSEADRIENGRRIAHVANLFVKEGFLVLCPVLSPFKEMRDNARNIIGDVNFVECYVKASLETCKTRDPKGLYATELKVRPNSTILHYDTPANPDITVDTENLSIEDSVSYLIAYANICFGYTSGGGI